MKITLFWGVTPCNLIEVSDVSEVLPAFIITVISSKYLRNASENIADYTSQHLRRQQLSKYLSVVSSFFTCVIICDHVLQFQ
jgi:hypothetical protein